MMPWDLSLKMLGLPTYQSVLHSDLSLIFDAILFDRSLYNPLFNHLSTLYLMLPRAKKRGKKLGYYNVGVGPVDTKAGREMLRSVSELMDFITVRDISSLNLLREIGVQNPRVLLTADAALTVQPASEERVNAIMKSLGFTAGEEILGININAYLDTWVRPKRPSMGKDKFLSIYANALSRVVKEIGCPIMFVSTQHHDVPVTRELMSKVQGAPKTALLSNVEFNHYDLKGAFGKLSLLFGMRLHATILSSSALTPTLGLAYQPKVQHYFEALNLPECSLDFRDFTEEGIAAHILDGWKKRGELRKKLEQRIPELQGEAYRAAEIVAAIGRGEDLDKVFAGFTSPVVPYSAAS